jgi:hypothetical protein
MSADMMIICKEDESDFKSKNYDAAFFIDETSMGNPHNDFGKWFQRRYCRAPGILEQISGLTEHDYLELTEHDYGAIKNAAASMGHHENLNIAKLMKFIKSHIGKHISTENW